MRPTIFHPLGRFDDTVSSINSQHGLWRSMNSPELDDLLLVSLLAILVSLWTSHGILWSKPQKGHQLYFVSPQLQEPIFKNIGRGPRQSTTRQVNDRMTELRKDIIVFWGSQSGNAERLANSFVRECIARFNLPAMAANLDLYDFDQLGELCEGRLVGFVLATYGEGNPTDNASGLYEYLCRIEKSRDRPLSRLRYFCFGLGNSKYQFYNSFVDYVDETLTLSGAQRIAPVGKIDEAQGSDEAWLSWKEEMLKSLAERFGSQENVGKQWPVFDLVNLDNGMTLLSHAAETSTTTNTNQQQFVRVSRSLQLSGSVSKISRHSVRTYLHIEFDTRIGSQVIQYETGDHVAIWPINPNDEVTLLATQFGWDKKTLKATIDIRPRDSTIDESVAVPVPTPTTREALLQYQLDICGPISPEILELLASYSPNAAAKVYLDRCRLDPKSRSDISNHHLTCGQLMKQAANGAVWPEDAFSALLSIMPKLRPRYFSIASSPLVDPYSFAITAGLVEKPIPQADRSFVGLTTGYLHSLHMKKNQVKENNRQYNLDGPRSILSGYKLFAHVRKSKFKLPVNNKTPIMMFAAGSGIAPFRGFVQERMVLSRRGDSVGKMILFYGSRSDDDCLYTDVWSEAEAMGILETHFVFSAQLVNGKKFYVQHRLLEHSETTKRLVQDEGGSVYICGSANMANAVKTSLGILLGGNEAIQQMRKSRQLQEDVWA